MIRVDQSKLSAESLRSWTLPEYYVDEPYTCIDCGVHCVFTAQTQQRWYEDNKTYIWVHPIRCTACHMSSVKQINAKKVMDGLIASMQNGEDLALDCARSILAYYKLSLNGDLQYALHLARGAGGGRKPMELQAEISEQIKAAQENN